MALLLTLDYFPCLYLSSSERFVLVLWPEENAVTIVAEGNIVDPSVLGVGDSCRVKMGRKTYQGQVALIGEYNWLFYKI